MHRPFDGRIQFLELLCRISANEFLEERAIAVYRPVPRSKISDALEHLRDLHRQVTPSNDRERHAAERRELLTKNLLSNLHRTKSHPTLTMLLEMVDMFSLTVEGAHRLFGYDLGVFGDYDRQLNARRTRIVESYAFERDRSADVSPQTRTGGRQNGVHPKARSCTLGAADRAPDAHGDL